jgi:hypothetical protein
MFGSTHELLMKVERMQLEYANERLRAKDEQFAAECDRLRAVASGFRDKLEDMGHEMTVINNNLRKSMITVERLSETNQKLADELLLLRGGIGRVKQEKVVEQEDDPLLAPDVIVHTEDGTRASDISALKPFLDNYEKALEAIGREVDVSRVTPEALAAATPKSVEDWKEEHAI